MRSMEAPEANGSHPGAPRTFWLIRVMLIGSLPPKPLLTRLKTLVKPVFSSMTSTSANAVIPFRSWSSPSLDATILAQNVRQSANENKNPNFGCPMTAAKYELHFSMWTHLTLTVPQLSRSFIEAGAHD